MKVLFIALAFPGFLLGCAAAASVLLRRTRRFAPYLSVPGAGLFGTAQILAGATGIAGSWHVTAGALLAALGAVNAAGIVIERHLRPVAGKS